LKPVGAGLDNTPNRSRKAYPASCIRGTVMNRNNRIVWGFTPDEEISGADD
jgi:hypothetical protein